jgi:hypothetical protein
MNHQEGGEEAQVRKVLSVGVAIAVVSLGLWMADLGQYYYLSTLQSLTARFPSGNQRSSSC